MLQHIKPCTQIFRKLRCVKPCTLLYSAMYFIEQCTAVHFTKPCTALHGIYSKIKKPGCAMLKYNAKEKCPILFFLLLLLKYHKKFNYSRTSSNCFNMMLNYSSTSLVFFLSWSLNDFSHGIQDQLGFSKHRPSGPMLYISRFIHICVCVCVGLCVSVCVFTV